MFAVDLVPLVGLDEAVRSFLFFFKLWWTLLLVENLSTNILEGKKKGRERERWISNVDRRLPKRCPVFLQSNPILSVDSLDPSTLKRTKERRRRKKRRKRRGEIALRNRANPKGDAHGSGRKKKKKTTTTTTMPF